ncbi:hypothetical protein GEMRC1_010321 [Eukaryota sp. GEM-RC1]
MSHVLNLDDDASSLFLNLPSSLKSVSCESSAFSKFFPFQLGDIVRFNDTVFSRWLFLRYLPTVVSSTAAGGLNQTVLLITSSLDSLSSLHYVIDSYVRERFPCEQEVEFEVTQAMLNLKISFCKSLSDFFALSTQLRTFNPYIVVFDSFAELFKHNFCFENDAELKEAINLLKRTVGNIVGNASQYIFFYFVGFISLPMLQDGTVQGVSCFKNVHEFIPKILHKSTAYIIETKKTNQIEVTLKKQKITIESGFFKIEDL